MIIEVLDIIGVFFLAISGILTAADKGLDFFGGVHHCVYRCPRWRYDKRFIFEYNYCLDA